MKYKKKTIGDMQKEYGIVFENTNPRMKLTTWFKRQGLSNLAKAYEVAERHGVQI